MATIEERIKELRDRKRRALQAGGHEAIAKQKARGKLTARERLDVLLDKDSFVELDMFVTHRCSDFGMEKQRYPGDGVITGFGTVNGRRVYVFSQDFTVLGGSLGEAHAQKIRKVMDMAVEVGAPIIGIIDSGGARIQEGLGHYGLVFYKNVQASGVVPQFSLILGPCAGGAVYSPALGDFVFMVEKVSRMFITGPKVVEAATGQRVTEEELGGATVHCSVSGNAHFLCTDELDCFNTLKELMSYLPSSNREAPPRVPWDCSEDSATNSSVPDSELESIIPSDPYEAYDMKLVVTKVLDAGKFLEVQANFAKNIIVGFGRIAGETVGVIANQPSYLAGCIDINASSKAARFILFCDAFNIPILTFVDCPGYLPGVNQEHGGIIRHGAQMIYAYSQATVPRITVVVRKTYGGAMSGMAVSKYTGTDLTVALPTAELAILGPEAAANVLFRDEIASAADPEQARVEKIRLYRDKFANPFVAAERGWVDAVVEPAELRDFLIKGFQGLKDKRRQTLPKKHGIIPL